MSKHEQRSGLGRREVLGLAAAGVAGMTARSAAGASPPPGAVQPGQAAVGPGIPVPTPRVQTRSGQVQGLVIDGVLNFRGIRYGAAPIGPLRWMPPQPAKPWTGVYDASAFGAPAMQVTGGVEIDAPNDFAFQMHQVFTTPSELKVMNEDCLYLNVWTPAADEKKRPVMFWIHGGGYAFGSGSQPIYQGDGLARAQDVVVVSVNHRLNVFGYLYLGEAMGPAYT
ncbi:MAG: carboxylesterase family protein, partial [Caulobacteraceae bacterium]